MIIRCNECNTILFKIQNGCIIMVSRHHGKQHINVIPIAKLVEWAERGGVSSVLDERFIAGPKQPEGTEI